MCAKRVSDYPSDSPRRVNHASAVKIFTKRNQVAATVGFPPSEIAPRPGIDVDSETAWPAVLTGRVERDPLTMYQLAGGQPSLAYVGRTGSRRIGDLGERDRWESV